MQKVRLIPLIVVLAGMLVFSGCASGVSQEEYDALAASLETAQGQSETLTAELNTARGELSDLESNAAQSAQLLAQLSAISAYSVWYDQYYGVGIFGDEVAVFNMRLGSLVAATGDANSQAAFNVYYAADQAYNLVVAELPTDSSAWSLTQYNSWVDTGKARADALGQVGGYLIKIVEQVDWFQTP